jgi:hypothetical protein
VSKEWVTRIDFLLLLRSSHVLAALIDLTRNVVLCPASYPKDPIKAIRLAQLLPLFLAQNGHVGRRHMSILNPAMMKPVPVMALIKIPFSFYWASFSLFCKYEKKTNRQQSLSLVSFLFFCVSCS